MVVPDRFIPARAGNTNENPEGRWTEIFANVIAVSGESEFAALMVKRLSP